MPAWKGGQEPRVQEQGALQFTASKRAGFDSGVSQELNLDTIAAVLERLLPILLGTDDRGVAAQDDSGLAWQAEPGNLFGWVTNNSSRDGPLLRYDQQRFQLGVHVGPRELSQVAEQIAVIKPRSAPPKLNVQGLSGGLLFLTQSRRA